MKNTVMVLALMMAFASQARLLPKMWSYQELEDQSDLVAIARPISTQETTERTDLPDISPATHVIGLSTEFAIGVVMKGDRNLKRLTLHHYKLAPLPPNVNFANGPNLAAFDPKSNSPYLLFLHRESDGRYSPVSGQVDPTLFSILRIDNRLVQ